MTAPEGPQHRTLPTCKGCKHFFSAYWREPSGDGETYDSGTSAKCLKLDRWITTYNGSEPSPPDWCPCADLCAPDPRTSALVEAVKNTLTGYDQWANCVSGTPEDTIASGALFARVNRLRAALAAWEA